MNSVTPAGLHRLVLVGLCGELTTAYSVAYKATTLIQTYLLVAYLL